MAKDIPKGSKVKKLTEAVRLCRQTVSLQAKEIKRLKVLSDHDFLTGLYNRHGFMREMEKFFSTLANHKKHPRERRALAIDNLSIIFIDIDDLKVVNDLYGHQKGDLLLKKAARVFKENVRDIDAVARWGGDEFIVGLVNASEHETYEIAKKLKEGVSGIAISGVKKTFSASLGIISAKSRYHKNISDIAGLIEQADMIMYKAKKEKMERAIIHHQIARQSVAKKK